MDTLLQKVPPAELGPILEKLKAEVKDPKEKEKLAIDYPVPFTVCTLDSDRDDGEKSFVLCPQNKVAEGEYRSPWTNHVFTVNKDGQGEKTSTKSPQTDEVLLELETKFNGVWAAYAKLYYGSEAVSSCYLGESESKQFRATFCISKECDDGAWNSFHVVHMDDPEEKTCQYHVNSTVWIKITPDCSEYSQTTTANVSGYLTKSTSKVMKIERFFLEEYHLQNIGTIVEANEIDMRSNLEQVHLPKTKNIMDSIQKEPEKPRQVNPLMGMIMDSSVLKKKLGQK